jgi:hypothetical protein
MEPLKWPLDRKATVELVERAVVDIDASGDDDRDALLTDLLYAVWGTMLAQNQ